MKSTSIVLPDTPLNTLVVSMPSMMNRFSEPDAPSICASPPALDSACAPGAVWMTDVKSRPFGMRSMTSFPIVANDAFCLTSISGDSAVTCTVSVTVATLSVRFTESNWPRESVTAATLAGAKPDRLAVTS